MVRPSKEIQKRNQGKPFRFAARIAGGVLLCQILFTGQALASSSYMVKKGETWSQISKNAGYPANELMKLNRKKNTSLAAGEVIVLPGGKNTLPKNPQRINVLPGTAAAYSVSKGDTLWSIAKHFGTAVQTLKADNKITSNTVKIGQQLHIRTMDETTAMVIGAADANSVEFKVGNEYQVFRVPNRSGETFQEISGKKVKIIYNKATKEIYTYKVQ
ncbi:LysM peptidoglycan-binding domain-containing protein [Bacillus sp. M6-12]|uniref:LysM peptidoglycan-binding domain-containing protein n=1 Tax=Bacillus sp. M6-12 TaxID=2054166 RepID=UPI0015E0C483|nr:LysM peptidoglycan-binding domain-containing protein [Bacillus sp. M6-12]